MNAIRARLGLAAFAAVLLSAATCEDNLGDVEPGAVVFRASVAPATLQAEGASFNPWSSADGRHLAFDSTAKNLALPSSSFKEIFVRDRWLDTVQNATQLFRRGDPAFHADCEQPSISPNGRFVAFLSKGNLTQVIDDNTDPMNPVPYPVQPTFNAYLIDLTQDVFVNLTAVIGQFEWPDADIETLSVSDTGAVAFGTAASNVPDPLGGNYAITSSQVFTKSGGTIRLVSHPAGAPSTPGNNSAEQPRISGDGMFVAFASSATNLTADPTNARRQIFIAAPDGSGMELVSRATGAAGATSDEHCLQPSVSYDGRYVGFLMQDNLVAGPGPLVPGETGHLAVRRDRDPAAPTTVLMGRDPFILILFSPLGGGGRTFISDDGRHLAYLTVDAALTDLHVRVGTPGGAMIHPSGSLLPPSGTLLDFPQVAISGDGQWVFWGSESPTQVLNDTNSASDVFGYGPLP